MRTLAQIHMDARKQAHKSQEYMAQSLGVARRTVQNWEKGTSTPTLDESIAWFRVLGMDPMPFYEQYIHGTEVSEEELEANQVLNAYLQLSPKQKRLVRLVMEECRDA